MPVDRCAAYGLCKLGDALDVFKELPRLNVSNNGTVYVFGKGTPLIYINNKQVREVS